MTESKWHKNLKNKIANENNGITEFKTPEGKRIDVKLPHRGIEIEKDPTQVGICTAIDALESLSDDKKEIRVKQKNLDKTKDMVLGCGISSNIIIKNQDGTRWRIAKPK